MSDSPNFDLSSFDPSTIDLSHLDPRERNRIQARQFYERELSLLLKGQNPWTKSGKPNPLPQTTRVEPTLEQLLPLMHAETRQALQMGEMCQSQRDDIIEFYKRQWKEAQNREQEEFRQELEQTAKAMDLIRWLQDHPDKSHLLPPPNASRHELHLWYEEMQKPVVPIPFPVGNEYLREDPGNREIQSDVRSDPQDFANERPVEIFFSYAHEDEALMNDVRRQLIVYERNGRIIKLIDRDIPLGSNWRDQIDERLNSAQIVLLFMSAHFIESKYCYEVEGDVALRRRETGEAEVIPIILRHCAWQDTPFGKLQALPRDALPVIRWVDRDEACLNVAQGVMAAVGRVIKGRKKNRHTADF